MQCERTKDIKVLQVSCSDAKRYLPPERDAIEAMKISLQDAGQINPIGVYPVTRNSYRLISGATRFRAASEMGWKTIRASIWSGSAHDFQIHELVENLDRHELTGQQRREMRAEIKRLQAERLASITPAKGGRGKKGGQREAARQEGIDERTVRRRKAEEKPRHNTENAAVSELASMAPARPKSSQYAQHKRSFDITERDLERLKASATDHHLSVSALLRQIVREWLDAAEQKKRNAA